MLASSTRSISEPRVKASLSSGTHAFVAPRKTKSTAAITTFTAGPASATANSCLGFSGIFSIREMPPMGSSVISRAPIPNAFAVKACPNS
jgi:hypothetical protein